MAIKINPGESWPHERSECRGSDLLCDCLWQSSFGLPCGHLARDAQSHSSALRCLTGQTINAIKIKNPVQQAERGVSVARDPRECCGHLILILARAQPTSIASALAVTVGTQSTTWGRLLSPAAELPTKHTKKSPSRNTYWGFKINPGDDLLSHGETPHYHRR